MQDMNQSSQFIPSSNTIQPEKNDPEINFANYIGIAWKGKWLIGVAFMSAFTIGVTVSLLLPETFEARSLIQIGILKNELLVNPAEEEKVFSTDTIATQIRTQLSAPNVSLLSVKNRFDVKTVIAQDKTKLNILEIKARGQNPQSALTLLTIVDQLLIERHQKLFETAIKTVEQEIGFIKQNKVQIGKQIVEVEKNIIRLDKDIQFYQKEITARADVKSEAQGRIVESYINLLDAVKQAKDAKVMAIIDLKTSLFELDQELQKKEFEKTYSTKPTTIKVAPVLPEMKIAPQRRQIVLIAGMIGLFLGVFCAFIIEFLRKNKSLLRNVSAAADKSST